MRTHISSLWAKAKIVVGTFLLFSCLMQLVYNLSQGYAIVPLFKSDRPIVWETFSSKIQPISISYPRDWIAHDLFQGNHGDQEAIGSIRVLGHNYPYVVIAHRQMLDVSLEEVADWGESRVNFSPYTSTPLEQIEINGKTALLRSYTYSTSNSERINCHHVYLLDDNDAYTIEMCINEKNVSVQLRSVWQQMIQSIRLVD